MSTAMEDLVVTFIEQHYDLTGKILTAEQAYTEFGIPVGAYSKALESKSVREGLEEKGIVFERHEADPENAWIAGVLTPDQLAVAKALLDLTDSRSNKKKLQDLGVHTQTYNAWLKDPVFRDYLAKRAKQMIGDNEHEVDLALLDRVRAGDLKAIEYFNEMTGRYSRPRANSSNVDIQNVLIRVIEIITEEVTNKDDAIRISNRLRSLAVARNVAGAISGSDEEPIVVPEIVQNRELEV